MVPAGALQRKHGLFVRVAEALLETFNSKMSKDYSWRDTEWLLGEWNGRAALKGVCRPDDARARRLRRLQEVVPRLPEVDQ